MMLGLLVSVALSLMIACGDGGAETASGPETPPTAPDNPRREPANVTPPTPKRITASVGRMIPDPETPMGTVDVAFTLPPGWGEETAWGKNRWGPDGGDLAFSFDTTCNGSCHPAAIAGNLALAFEGYKESAARPNVNSGDPAKDAIRATVETVADETQDNRRLVALRVTYSEEVLASGPYRPQLRVLCAWHQPGNAWYLTLSLRADLEAGEAILPNLLDVCRSVEVEGPTPNDAQQRDALVVDGNTCTLASVPETAYTVESRNSKEQPSVILLTRPVVLGGLPLAPIGRFYVEYNDDPITLRDVFTAEDRVFEVGDVEITCLRRQPLRIDGTCAVRRCVLARETRLGAELAPAYSEVTFGIGSDGEPRFMRIVPPAK